MSKFFEVDGLIGSIEEVTVKHKLDDTQLRAKIVFEDAEYEITVTVKPKFADLHDKFFAKIPYRLTLKPNIKQLDVEDEEE